MLHEIKYCLKNLVRDHGNMFWALVFPLILGTMFYFSFWGDGETLSMEPIQVGMVSKEETGETKYFKEFIDALEEEVLITKTYTKKQAEEAMKEGSITGFFTLGEKITLTVSKTGVKESILSELLKGYQENANMVKEVAQKNPDQVEHLLENMAEEASYVKEVSIGGKPYNSYIQFFYALIAYSCMSGSFLGLKGVLQLKANVSALGARRMVSPTHKMKIIVSNFLVITGVHLLNIVVLLGYLHFILGIQVLENPLPVILVCTMGCMIGVMIGIFIGALGKISEELKNGFVVLINLGFSFLAGLMMLEMKYIVENHAPIINRLNPAALVTDAFYALMIYDDPARFIRNIISLAIISAVLLILSFLAVREEQYDSI